jgi:hypothetical protein
MLQKPSSGVLASLKNSTYRSVRLVFSLAAALLDELFQHPACCGTFFYQTGVLPYRND